jgi:hypothetical protein
MMHVQVAPSSPLLFYMAPLHLIWFHKKIYKYQKMQWKSNSQHVNFIGFHRFYLQWWPKAFDDGDVNMHESL